MKTPKQDSEITPVLFRVHRSPIRFGNEVTAVFPTEPGDIAGHFMSCYVHVGQHGQCGLDWYRHTRPAAPAEYADLKRELESAGYRLRPYQRMTSQHRATFNAAVRAFK